MPRIVRFLEWRYMGWIMVPQSLLNWYLQTVASPSSSTFSDDTKYKLNIVLVVSSSILLVLSIALLANLGHDFVVWRRRGGFTNNKVYMDPESTTREKVEALEEEKKREKMGQQSEA